MSPAISLCRKSFNSPVYPTNQQEEAATVSSLEAHTALAGFETCGRHTPNRRQLPFSTLGHLIADRGLPWRAPRDTGWTRCAGHEGCFLSVRVRDHASH